MCSIRDIELLYSGISCHHTEINNFTGGTDDLHLDQYCRTSFTGTTVVTLGGQIDIKRYIPFTGGIVDLTSIVGGRVLILFVLSSETYC